MSKPAKTVQDHPHMLNGLSEIIDRYDHFIIDIYGVLHDGITPFPGTIETLTELKKSGKQICLLSNAPRRIPGVTGRLETIGIRTDLYDHAVSSGEATWLALKNRDDDFHKSCGDRCWFIGTEIVSEIIAGIGIEMMDGPEEASFIVNSIPGAEGSDANFLRKQLHTAREKNLPMICANPDLVVNIGDEQYECAGTFAAFYESIGGEVVYHGKPHAPVYEHCLKLLGMPDKSKILAIGDSFHTDITGANNFGIDSVFNLVGIHWEEVQIDHAPGEADIEKIRHMIENSAHQPTYVMASLNW